MKETIRNFGNIKETYKLPNMVVIQTASYAEFLQADVPRTKRKQIGLEGAFREAFPIESFDGKYKLENEYDRVVKPGGNISAMKLISEVFDTKDAAWRGFGTIEKSGLFINEKYTNFDAEKLIDKPQAAGKIKNINCRCADVVKGKISPSECPQFKKNCTVDNPLGPCMVSFEGTCRIYYEYSA